MRLTKLAVHFVAVPLLLCGSVLCGSVGAQDASVSSKPTFSGRWSTTFGPMELVQKGDRVTGTYSHAENPVTGTVSDGELTLAYDDQGGEATFELWEEAGGFSGDYTTGKGQTGSWSGYRLRKALAPATREKITAGQTESGLNYHLRVPRRFDGKRRFPAIGFLHGSNMSSRAYVNTIAARWPKLAADFILVGFDGERMTGNSRTDRRAYNFTYVNFSGADRGPLSSRRQSPALVAEALDELKGQLPIERWYLGGHSQGGFLTYAVFMYYPDKVAGVFPMSCNLLVQCDPEFFKDEELRRKQRQVAIAVIHGENDRVVDFSGGEWCYRSMMDGGFPLVQFFTDESAAHMFARLPVERAVQWLESATSTDVMDLLEFGEAQHKAGRYPDASAALDRIRTVGVPGDLRANAKALGNRIDKKARAGAVKWKKAILANKNNGWVDGFLEYREQFAFADAARDAMAAYAALREKHREPAEKLFYEARRIRDETEREAKYQEIIDKYYASKWYAHVKPWIDE